ncbi:hypothetical protein Tco_1563641 [Tanacetum coccineum]
MYEKLKRSDEDFIAIGSVADEKLIKRMNKKDSSKEEEINQESKVEVKEEDKGEENTRKRKQQLCLTIAPDEDKEVDYEILDKKYPIIEWKTENLGTKPQFDESKSSEEINVNVVTRSNGQKRFFSTLIGVLSVLTRRCKCLVSIGNGYITKIRCPEGFERVKLGRFEMVLFKPDEQNEFGTHSIKWKCNQLEVTTSS